MLKKILVLASLTFSLSANAADITYNNYTLDMEANVVTGGGLDWLQWDVTDRLTIEEALNLHGGEGWGLASNSDMAKLFNDFNFGHTFDSDENTQEYHITGTSDAPSPITEADVQFVALFGSTFHSGSLPDPLLWTGAIFGQDSDGDGYYNRAYVQDDWTHGTEDGYYQGIASIDSDFIERDVSYDFLGVALVRPSAVPLPAAGWLFISALVGLVGKKRLSRR